MKLFFSALIAIASIPDLSFMLSVDQVNPTGTYLLKGSIKKNIIEGHNGEIRVKLLDENKLAMSLYINKGAPNFESAFFSDTLQYFDNQANYNSPIDSDCTINVVFGPTTAEIFFVHSNPDCTCGFAKGVIITAVFEKISAETPVIKKFR
ncbi:MAG TPA: hypothetical protein VMT76_16840 [Puia sp.]|nr:hypothetical protein [Puia sp.]